MAQLAHQPTHQAAIPASLQVLTPAVGAAVSRGDSDGVGAVRQGLTDDEREAAIKRAGAAMQKHYARYAETGCFAARGDADRALRLMELLIASRSPEAVANLERERGLL